MSTTVKVTDISRTIPLSELRDGECAVVVEANGDCVHVGAIIRRVGVAIWSGDDTVNLGCNTNFRLKDLLVRPIPNGTKITGTVVDGRVVFDVEEDDSCESVVARDHRGFAMLLGDWGFWREGHLLFVTDYRIVNVTARDVSDRDSRDGAMSVRPITNADITIEVRE